MYNKLVTVNLVKERSFMLISGYCPAKKGNQTINVSYIDASTLEEKQYVKGTFRCEYNLFGDKCNGNDCPIYKQAPEYK